MIVELKFNGLHLNRVGYKGLYKRLLRDGNSLLHLNRVGYFKWREM